MEQYIPKAKLMAEIEEIMERNYPCLLASDQSREDWMSGKSFACNILISNLNLIDMKEVDFEKEFKRILNEVEGVPRMWYSDEQIEWAKDLAKRFFELGLKAQKGEKI